METATRSQLQHHLSPVLRHLLVLAILGTLAAGPSTADQVLYPGYSLTTGQSLSVNGYTLVMQTDCNLVLYDRGRAVWATGTYGHGSNCRVTMQRDGNLVIYNGGGSAVWASNTARGTGFYALALQTDRNLVIYGNAIWATATNANGAQASIPKGAVPSDHGAGVVLAGGNAVPAADAVAGIQASNIPRPHTSSHGGAGALGGGKASPAAAGEGGNN